MVIFQSAQQGGLGAGATSSFNTPYPPGATPPGASGDGRTVQVQMTIQTQNSGGTSCLTGHASPGGSGINVNIQNVGAGASSGYVVTFVVFSQGGNPLGF